MIEKSQLSPDVEVEDLLSDVLGQIYRNAYFAAAKQLGTPAPQIARGLLDFERVRGLHTDALKLSDEERRKQLGDRVKAQRQALGLKQKELAEMVGVVPQVLSVWESGKQEPSPKAIISLSRALKVSCGWVLGEEA